MIELTAQHQLALELEARAARDRLARDLKELLRRRTRVVSRVHVALALVAIGGGVLSVSYLAVRSRPRGGPPAMRPSFRLSLLLDGVMLGAAALLVTGHRSTYRSSLPTLPDRRPPEPW